MIATREEDPARIAREQAYSLRRILVRRLQGVTRGVPRRERIHRMRRFAEEWRALKAAGGLGELHQALAASRIEPRSSGLENDTLLRSLARGRAASDPRPMESAPAVPEHRREVYPGKPGIAGQVNWPEQQDLFLPLAS